MAAMAETGGAGGDGVEIRRAQVVRRRMVANIEPGGGRESLPKDHDTSLPGSLTTQQTEFSGEARVGQVLRWVSTSALRASFTQSTKSKKYTPEIQASVAGGRLLLGTNARDDSDVPKDLFRAVAGTAKKVRLTQNPKSLDPAEAQRIERMDERHLGLLQNFVHDDDSFTAFHQQTMNEMQAEMETGGGDADQVNAHQSRMAQVSSMLGTIRDALRTDPSHPRSPGLIQIAGYTDHKQHAEQRIVEHVQTHHDDIFAATVAKRSEKLEHFPELDGPGSAALSELILPLAGTKPPCLDCHKTEVARNKVAQAVPAGQPVSPFVITRYKDTANPVGHQFPGDVMPTQDQRVVAAKAALTPAEQMPRVSQSPRRTDSRRILKTELHANTAMGATDQHR